MRQKQIAGIVIYSHYNPKQADPESYLRALLVAKILETKLGQSNQSQKR